ncbi:serine hydrolase domain-containing protein [Alteromonas sp. AMM-1]|uniref:serine hydrolase domain-containing protein n=1 Tax=Alteromonas sp. AMM-1 TaxID=3394233 RepID=UPI0039A57C32
MKRFIFWTLGTLVILVAWVTVNFVATTEGWGLTPLAEPGDTIGFTRAISNEARTEAKGNLVLAVLNNGKVVHSDAMSTGKPVSDKSVFGVASLSKWVTAVGVMQLAQQGKLDLDVPVSTYLTRWQLPPSEFDNNKVTLRLLLSHTAGITDGLGHSGFAPGEPVQALESHLTQAMDADPGKSGKVQVGIEPGTTWMYSGGSYNLTQLIVEEVTGESFAQYMQKAVFEPLGMTHSSFILDRADPTVAQYFGENGVEQVYPNYTSLAATGLYTTLSDLVRFANAQLPSTVADPAMPRLLSDSSLADMRTPIANIDGLDIWGTGIMLFAPNGKGDNVVGHGGQSPYLNSTVRIDPASGDGFIAIQSGNKEALASNLATHWTTWKTGKPDIYVLGNTFPAMIMRVLTGAVVILVTAIALGIFTGLRRKRANR